MKDTVYAITLTIQVKVKRQEEAIELGNGLIDHIYETFNDDESIGFMSFKVERSKRKEN